jgi:transcriptional regulator
MEQPSLEVLKGTLDVLILKTLSWGPAHGYGITRWLERTTDAALQIEEGALYPALHRLERRGWVVSEWGLSENKRRAKFYELTDEGRVRLQESEAGWERFVDAMTKVLKSDDPVALP